MALSFVSGNPRVNLGPVAEVSGAAAMSIATWINLHGRASDDMIAIRGNLFAASAPWILWRDDVTSVSGRVKTVAALINTDIGTLRVEAANNLLGEAGVWRHVAMVFQAGVADGFRVYVDGVRDANYQSTVGHSQLVASTADVTIGMDDDYKRLEANLAEFSIWNAALDDAEVAQLAAGFAPTTLASWPARLVTYHDLIAGLNRPGIGGIASSAGTIVTAPHPRVIYPHSVVRGTSHSNSLVPGPHRTAAGQLRGAGSSSAQCFIPGAAAGATTSTGEVFS